MFDLVALARLDAGLAELAGRDIPGQGQYLPAAVSSPTAPLTRDAEPPRCPFAHGAAA